MPKGRNHLNTIYISERLQECLRPISQCALTTVTAPDVYLAADSNDDETERISDGSHCRTAGDDCTGAGQSIGRM